jgi:hypothetical protein
MTQQSIPETEPAELTGVEGHIEALRDSASKWQMRYNGNWHDDWYLFPEYHCNSSMIRWRRRPNPTR